METYDFIADVNELKWAFDHLYKRPQLWESYSFVLAVRNKKLTDEEKLTLGMTGRQKEFLQTEVLRGPRVKSLQQIKTTYDNMVNNITNQLKNNDLKSVSHLFLDDTLRGNLEAANSRSIEAKEGFLSENPWTFEHFLKVLYRFNVDKRAYATSNGSFVPEKCMVVLTYINPANDMHVIDQVMADIQDLKTRIVTAVINGKEFTEIGPLYQEYTNMIDKIKHYKAQFKGTKYWVDFDIDLPAWFKESSIYMNKFKSVFNSYFGKGNYLLVNTGGGYHVLVKQKAMKCNPNNICKDLTAIYKEGVADGNPEYLNEKGECKFEAELNNSQIPGLPLPGTYQYGRLVTIDNKEDFIDD